MVHLNKFVPKVSDDDVTVVATHGDCGAVDRMIDAKRARAADLTACARLEGLEPVPQEFHHRGLMLQVCKKYSAFRTCGTTLLARFN